jgi:hypothetical protein
MLGLYRGNKVAVNATYVQFVQVKTDISAQFLLFQPVRMNVTTLAWKNVDS